MLQNFTLYRVTCISVTVARVLPRYLWLLSRARLPLLPAPSDAAWQRTHEFAAERIYRLGVHLGGLIVKFGQIVAARADVFPEPFIRKLGAFHDDVPARPFSALRSHVERQLGEPVEDAFHEVVDEPLAAASLAQVHCAITRSGARVVLKVQYPEIARIAKVDIASVRRVAHLVGRLQHYVDLRSLVNEVSHFIALELDFEREARSCERLARELADAPDVRVPATHPEYCRPKLLVFEYLEGIQVTDLDALRAAGHDLTEVAHKIARLYCEMIFESGFFHGDPHPGNLLVLEDGRIGLLDFGLCKELPEGFGGKVSTMILSAVRGDGANALAAARSLGFGVDGIAAENVPALIQTLLGDRPPDQSLVGLIQQDALANIPDDFPLVGRTLIILNGLSHRLAPGEHLIQREMLRAMAQASAGERAATA